MITTYYHHQTTSSSSSALSQQLTARPVGYPRYPSRSRSSLPPSETPRTLGRCRGAAVGTWCRRASGSPPPYPAHRWPDHELLISSSTASPTKWSDDDGRHKEKMLNWMRRWYKYLYWRRLIQSVSHTSKFLPACIHNPTNETISGIANERTNKPTSGTINGTTNQRTITNQRTKQPTYERNNITTTRGTSN